MKTTPNLLAAILLCAPLNVIAEFAPPSEDFLVFLADFTNDDGEWVDPLELDEDVPSDTEEEK